MDNSKGRYWDKPWSLVDGCTPCSPGCDHCWSASMAHRFYREHLTTTTGKFNGHVVTRPDRLDIPLRTRKPTVFSVWNDLFHEDVPDEFIDQVHAAMLVCKTLERVSRHTFLVLTKRSDRMASYYSVNPSDLVKRWAEAGNGIVTMDDEDMYFSEYIMGLTCFDWNDNGYNSSNSEYKPWRYFNRVEPDVWHGVTVCNQAEADEKIPELLKVLGKHFVSYEPALGPVNLSRFMAHSIHCIKCHPGGSPCNCPRIDLIIAGGETGPGARPLHPDWVRSVRDQCVASGVPFYFKQWGEWEPIGPVFGELSDAEEERAANETGRREIIDFHGIIWPSSGAYQPPPGSFVVERVGSKVAGRLLDGKEHNELPWIK